MRSRFIANLLFLPGLLLAAGLVIGCKPKPSMKEVRLAIESDLQDKTVASGDSLGNYQMNPPLHFGRSTKTDIDGVSEIRTLQFGKYDDARDCWPIKILITIKVKEIHRGILWPRARQEVYDFHTLANKNPWERCIGEDDSGKWVLK
jgi:hypothetical protein